MEPAGGPRGTEFEIAVAGDQLDRVIDVLPYSPLLRVKRFQAESPERLVIEFASEKSAPPGAYPLRLVTALSVSDVVAVHLGPFTQFEEQEPNDRPAQAAQAQLGSTFEGVIEEGDVDCYRVELKQGQRLSAEVEAVRLGPLLFDAYLEIVDGQGRTLAWSDDTSLFGPDPRAAVVAPADGAYYVCVREAAFGGDLDAHYRLHLGEFRQPNMALPVPSTAGGRAVRLWGDPQGTYELALDDASLNPGLQTWRPPGEGAAAAPFVLPLFVPTAPLQIEQEPNDDFASLSTAPSLPLAVVGALQGPGDRDRFAFSAVAGERFELETWAARLGSPADLVATIFDEQGAVVATNDDHAGHDSGLRFVAPATGRYWLEIRDHLGAGGDDFGYCAQFAPAVPACEAFLATSGLATASHQQSYVAVPQGGRTLALVGVRRQNFTGAVSIQAEALPPGVTWEAEPVAEDSHLALVTLVADGDAPRGAAWVRAAPAGRDAFTGQEILGRFRQPVGLTVGEPRQTVYHSVDVDQFPLVVTPPLPFALSLDSDRMVCVQDGRCDLQVTVRRAPGFAGPIELLLPSAPPWLEPPEEPVVIPAGADAATFPLRVYPEAALRSWRLAVVGRADVDGQTAAVATPWCELTIESPRVAGAIARAAAAQGARTTVACALEWQSKSIEPAEATLRGLPPGAECAPVELAGGNTAIQFAVQVGPETPVGLHNSLYVELKLQEGRPIPHYLARGGVLEVLAEGATPREMRSRLEVLRSQIKPADNRQGTSP